MKVLHVITNLSTGGAETMLYRLLSRMDRASFDAEVVSLVGIGPVGQKIVASGVPVRTLGMRQGLPNPLAVLRLSRWIREIAPDVIQTWMYHADLAGGLATTLGRSVPVVWGIHNSNLDPKDSKRLTIWTAKICARLSHHVPARIVCCSDASQQVHSRLGYAPEKMVVIPNGFDLTAFGPDPAARRSVRRELEIPEEALLIGLVARFDPQKDHRNFIQAAASFQARAPGCHFVFCGDGITWENEELAGWIAGVGMRDSFHLLGRRDDIPRLTAAFDLGTTSSAYGEAFPLVIGEAMACGVPCVVTDVGDSATIVGPTGVVVPPRDPHALADGWARLLLAIGLEERQQLGSAARQRIMERFNLDKITEEYQDLYSSVVVGTGRRAM